MSNDVQVEPPSDVTKTPVPLVRPSLSAPIAKFEFVGLIEIFPATYAGSA